MSDYGLSSQQLAVICALSYGATMTAAADQAGIHRNTIANWRRNSLPFQQGVAHAQYDRALYYREKAEDLIDLAIQTIRDILTDPKAPASIKLKAALAIVGIASTPPAPKKQVELDIEKIVVKRSAPETVTEDQLAPAPPATHNDAQPVQPSDPPTPHKDAQPVQPPAPPATHKDAQPTPEISVNSRPFAAKSIPRNAQCPCGSGKKYKRCCLDRPQASAA